MPAPTPTIQVHILAGRGAGKRVLLSESPIAFGRSAQATIAVDSPHASREHGELRFDDDQWWLVNHSPNGTQLGRKTVNNKPRILPTGKVSVIGIGGTPLFEVVPAVIPAPGSETGEDDAPGATPSDANAPGGGGGGTSGGGLTRRAKLWIGIGVYLLIMLALAIFFSTLRSNDDDAGPATIEVMSEALIREEILETLPPRPPEPARVREYMDIAAQELALEASEPDALYRAHAAYRVAASYAGSNGFTDPLHQRQAFLLEDRLSKEVTAQYERAYNLLQARQYAPAADALRKLLAMYPAESNSALRRHVEHLLAQAKKGMGKKR